VSVGVAVGISVGVLVGVFVGASVGVWVAVGRSVGVLVGVSVGVSVGVLVAVLVGTFVGVCVAVGVSVGTVVGVEVAVGVDVGGLEPYSKAPISNPAPCGRLTPRWSASGPAGAASTAGLLATSAWVRVGPPLSANGARMAERGWLGTISLPEGVNPLVPEFPSWPIRL
jgi:hypothetical protein